MTARLNQGRPAHPSLGGQRVRGGSRGPSWPTVGSSPARRRRALRGGFTLVELVLVILLVAGLLSIVPSVIRRLGGPSVRSAVSDFLTAHRFARATATRDGRVSELHVDAENARFWVEVDTSEAWAGVMDTVRMVQYGEAGPLVMASNRSLVCFDGRGLATTVGDCEAGDVTITFAMAGRADTVTASALGKILR